MGLGLGLGLGLGEGLDVGELPEQPQRARRAGTELAWVGLGLDIEGRVRVRGSG